MGATYLWAASLLRRTTGAREREPAFGIPVISSQHIKKDTNLIGKNLYNKGASRREDFRRYEDLKPCYESDL